MSLWLHVAFLAVAAAGQAEDDFANYRTASFKSGVWTAGSADWKDDADGPMLACRMRTAGAELVQFRRAESGQMDANLNLLADENVVRNNLRIDWIDVDGTHFQFASLPWRLARPSEDGTILAYGIVLQTVRRDAGSPWLPVTYLTLPLVAAKSMRIGYHYEDDSKPVRATKSISLNGFRAVTNWCGRQLRREPEPVSTRKSAH